MDKATATVELIPAPPEWRFSEVQATAVNLYRRGLNVFPVPRGEKQPYILRPLYYGRLHLCGPGCPKRKRNKGHKCHPDLTDLFAGRRNLAVMTGRTSGNLVAIDCDTPAAFRAVGAELTRRGIPYWAYTSARGGGYLVRLAEGEAANTKATINGVEIWGHMHYVLLPPSVHPSGIVYQWATTNPLDLPPSERVPVVSVQALDWLGVALYRPQQPYQAGDLHGLPSWAAHLSEQNRRILAQALTGGYEVGERNTWLTKPLYDLAAIVQDGLAPEEEALALLEKAARALDYPVKHVRQMWTSAMCKHDLKRAKPENPQRLEVLKALAFEQTHDWSSHKRTNHTDRMVFRACIERARRDAGHNSFRASIREVAELAGVSAKTAQAALHRLKERRLLEWAGVDPSGANRWRFGPEVANSVLHNYHTTPTRGDSVVTTQHSPATSAADSSLVPEPAAADVFHRLGRTAWLIYQHLLRQPEHTKGAIARAVGVHRSTVGRVLKRLMAHGLVVWSGAEGLYYAEPASRERLERIAAALGPDRWGREALGATERRKREHEVERELYRTRVVAQAIERQEGRLATFRELVADGEPEPVPALVAEALALGGQVVAVGQVATVEVGPPARLGDVARQVLAEALEAANGEAEGLAGGRGGWSGSVDGVGGGRGVASVAGLLAGEPGEGGPCLCVAGGGGPGLACSGGLDRHGLG